MMVLSMQGSRRAQKQQLSPCQASSTCMQAKLQDMRRLIWFGGSQAPSATRPRGPDLALAWPMRSDMERWNSQDADREGWYGCTPGQCQQKLETRRVADYEWRWGRVGMGQWLSIACLGGSATVH